MYIYIYISFTATNHTFTFFYTCYPPLAAIAFHDMDVMLNQIHITGLLRGPRTRNKTRKNVMNVRSSRVGSVRFTCLEKKLIYECENHEKEDLNLKHEAPKTDRP